MLQIVWFSAVSRSMATVTFSLKVPLSGDVYHSEPRKYLFLTPRLRFLSCNTVRKFNRGRKVKFHDSQALLQRQSQYCGELPWPRGSVLGLRPPGLEFRILCLEDTVISFISPSSGGSPGPVWPICAQRWPKARFISFSFKGKLTFVGFLIKQLSPLCSIMNVSHLYLYKS